MSFLGNGQVYEESIEEVVEPMESDFVDPNVPITYRRGERYSAGVTADPNVHERYQGDEFDYTEEKEEEEPPVEREEEEEVTPHEPGKKIDMGGTMSIVFNGILIVAGGFLVFFIFQLLKDFRIEKRASQKTFKHSEKEVEEEEEVIEELDKTDLAYLISKAKEAQNFPLAIRYQFLNYLKKLQDKDLVSYHKDKTNADYSAELSRTAYQEQFKKMAYIFEYIWYGKKPIDASLYASLEKIFTEQTSKT